MIVHCVRTLAATAMHVHVHVHVRIVAFAAGRGGDDVALFVACAYTLNSNIRCSVHHQVMEQEAVRKVKGVLCCFKSKAEMQVEREIQLQALLETVNDNELSQITENMNSQVLSCCSSRITMLVVVALS